MILRDTYDRRTRALRRALAALTGDPDARAVIVTTHGCGYDLDRDAARRYPVIAAALEGCTP